MRTNFKEFAYDLIAQGQKTAEPPGTYVTLPLRELINALALFEAQYSEEKCWVEICISFVAYDSLAVTFFTPDSAPEPKRGRNRGG